MTHKELKIFYLRSQTSGILGDFNKKCFPVDFDNMKKELELIESRQLDGEGNNNKGEK